MYNNKATTKRLLAYVSAMALMSSQAMAATQSVTANIAFDTVLSISKVADIDFGVEKAGVTGTTTITTANDNVGVTGNAVALSGSPHRGNLTISGSATQTISISAGSYVADGSSTPSAAKCKYNGGAESDPCSLATQVAPAGGKTLLLGVVLTLDGNAVAGDTDEPTFVITVTYT